MSEIKNYQSPEQKNPLAGEKILADAGVRGLVASDLPASEVIGTLSKRVRVAKVQTEKYEYLIPKLFGKNMVFDGMIDVDYTELQTTDSSDPYSDTVIADFNGETNKAIRFTYAAETQSNVKTKILDQVLMNFKTNPNDAITSIYTGTENINKTQSAFWAGQVWEVISNEIVDVDVSSMEDVASTGESVNKAIYTVLKNYATTRKGHLGVGNGTTKDGTITTAGGDSVEPSMKYDSSEFYLIQSVSFDANTVYDGEKVFLNWGNTPYELAGTYTLDFANAEEIPEELRDTFGNYQAILIHKEAIYGIQDWEGTGIASAGKLYTIFKNYMKQDAIPIYDKPIIGFNGVAVVPPVK